MGIDRMLKIAARQGASRTIPAPLWPGVREEFNIRIAREADGA